MTTSSGFIADRLFGLHFWSSPPGYKPHGPGRTRRGSGTAAQHRSIGIEPTGTVRDDGGRIDHRPEVAGGGDPVVPISWLVRNPSKKCRNGMRVSSVVA